jgi:hypothetical protein
MADHARMDGEHLQPDDRAPGTGERWRHKVVSGRTRRRRALTRPGGDDRPAGAADAAAGSVKDLADATAAGARPAKRSSRSTTKQSPGDMDAWSRKIKNTDPWAYSERDDPHCRPLEAGGRWGHRRPGDQDVRRREVAAEVVARRRCPWSEAMDLVRQGQGTMTGSQPGAAAGRHVRQRMGADADDTPVGLRRCTGMRRMPAPRRRSMGGSATPAGATVAGVTVNSVAGETGRSPRSSRLLASDWRSSG